MTVGFGVRNVPELERGAAELRRVLRPGGRARDPRDHAAARRARAVLPALVRPARPAAREGAARRRRLHVPARERAPLPAAGGARGAARGAPASATSATGSSPAASSRSTSARPCERGSSPRSATRRASAGYLGELEARLDATVRSHPGVVADAGADALAAAASACVRCSSSSRRRRSASRRSPAGVAVELVHMATLVHDDVIDGAPRPPRPPVGLGRARSRRGARATGDYLFARAFAELAATGDAAGVAVLVDAALALVRGESLQRQPAARPRRRPSTRTSSAARSRRGSCSRPRACSAAATLRWAASGSRSGSRSRSPTTSSTARARRSRPARCRAPTCARGRRRCRCCSPRATTRPCARRSPAGRSTAR